MKHLFGNSVNVCVGLQQDKPIHDIFGGAKCLVIQQGRDTAESL